MCRDMPSGGGRLRRGCAEHWTFAGNWIGTFVLCLSMGPTSLLGADGSVVLPRLVDECTRSKDIASRGTLSAAVNPHYLRGDFDGDGRADYAVAMKGTSQES